MFMNLPNNQSAAKGDLGILINGKRPPLAWTLKNTARNGKGFLAAELAKTFSAQFGLPVMVSELHVTKISADGEKTDYGIVSQRVITDVGADKIALAFNAGFTLADFNYHGVGTGTTSEAAGDTALVTESTSALNPDSTRATGTQSNPASKQYRTVGVVTFDAGAAITEHGIFSQAATGGGSLLDRSVFSAINVVSGDSIQFTYTLSITSGG